MVTLKVWLICDFVASKYRRIQFAKPVWFTTFKFVLRGDHEYDSMFSVYRGNLVFKHYMFLSK